jgi:hypothetical protein
MWGGGEGIEPLWQRWSPAQAMGRPVQGDTSLVGELPKAARQDTKFSNVLLVNRDLLRLLRIQDRPLRSSSNAAQPCRQCTLVREPPAVIGT